MTWKYAATLDGRSAAADGTSRWITGEASRADVHRLRAEADAVVAGVGTVLADDPLLDARGADATRRSRCASSSTPRGRTPLTARALQGSAPALVVTGPLLDDPGYPRRREVATGADGRVDLAALLAPLQDEDDVVSVLLEGGPSLAGALRGAPASSTGSSAYVAPGAAGRRARRAGRRRRGNDRRRAPVAGRRRDADRRGRAPGRCAPQPSEEG